MSIYKKIHQVQAATRSLAANAIGQTGAARYNYVSGSKLLGIIRPLMDKLGLILTQEVVDIKNEPITYMTRNGEKTEMFTTVHIRFTWVDTEDSSQMVNEFFANGMNAWDKGLGSALTYAERYYLMKTFHIATDDDDVDALVKEEAIKSLPSQAVQARRAAAMKPVPKEKEIENGVMTPEQFRERWNSDEEGGGITYEDIAVCARSWGLFPKPKIEPIEKVKMAVLKAAGVQDEQPYTPMADKDYWKIVKAYAEGKKTKTGGDYRQTWIEMTHAKAEHIAEFDNSVDDYKAANGINL